MIISVLKDIDYKSSTGIVDSVNDYSKTVNQTFVKGMELKSGDNIFERTGETLTPTPYVSADEQGYSVNQIIWKDNKIQYVSSVVGNNVIKQPEEYSPAPPTSMAFGSFGHRYTKLGTLANNVWTTTVNGITHKLYHDGSTWKYSLTKTVHGKRWTPQKYVRVQGGSSYLSWKYTDLPQPLKGRYENELIESAPTEFSHIKSNNTIFTSTHSNIYNGDRFKVGAFVNASSGVNYYYIMREEAYTDVITTTYSIQMITSSDFNVHEAAAICVNSTNCTNEWYPKSIVLRGNVLYARTNTNDPVQTKNVNGVSYGDVNYLTDAGGWGWTFIRPSDVFAPLDRKRYTKTEAVAPVMYTVTGVQPFDTIAINGLILDTDTGAVEVTFLPTDGSAAIPMITITPDSHRDKDGRLSKYQTTTIAYAPRDIIGDVKFEFKGTGNVTIGGIMLGRSVDAGFTNLVFTNKFIDRSPYERDQWGNVLYVQGLKQNVFKGTVDVLITNYDMINRLMVSIGGETVIINGSDSKTNQPVDDINFFSSTMLIGRMSGFELRTKLENKDMSQMATYNLEVIEDV